MPGGPQPHPLRLVMHLPAGQRRPPQSSRETGEPRDFHPLTSPLGYNWVWNRVLNQQEEEEEWAGARELVDSSYQPTYVDARRATTPSLRLVMHLHRPTGEATSIFKGNGRTT